jgi:hypothetical protein
MDYMHDHLIAKIRHIVFMGVGFIALITPLLPAQTDNVSSQSDSTFEIRVEAHEVIVPVVVENIKRINHERNSFLMPKSAMGGHAKDIFFPNNHTMSDFHIYEDGVEQSIRSISVIPIRLMITTDNIGYYYEYSGTPKGIWGSPYMWIYDNMWVAEPPYILLPVSHTLLYDKDENARTKGMNKAASDQLLEDQYLISYVPRASAEGSCHQIKVTLDSKEDTVYYRDEYCNILHSPSDPLKGTKIAKTMDEYAEIGQKGTIPLSIQATSTFINTNSGRVNIAVEFPWKLLSTYKNGDYRGADVAILGMIYTTNGRLTKRFSDIAFSPRVQGVGRETVQRSQSYVDGEATRLPTRYETQVDLASGSYRMRIVLTDGTNFGRADVPFTVETYDPNNISVSGIVLGKRFVKMDTTWPQNVSDNDFSELSKSTKREVSTAPEYVPLVSKDIGITPAGDTRSHKGGGLLTYFEIYEPALVSGQAKVQYEMRVVDAKTDKTVVDTGLRSADSYVNPGKLIIPIAEGIAFKKFHAGAYRVEVQASDFTGKQTPWRSATFTVE